MAESPSGTITLLFSDIEDPTLLLRRLGDGYAGLLARHRQLLREALERHGGLEQAAEVFERKGNLTSLDKARRTRADLER